MSLIPVLIAIYIIIGSMIVMRDVDDDFIFLAKDMSSTVVDENFPDDTEEEKDHFTKILVVMGILLTIATWPYFVWVVYLTSDDED